MERLLYEVKKVIVGQDHLLERLVIALLCRGHILVEGVPGLAKTMAIKTVADTIGGEFKRIQFTPDLVPADLVGTRIYNQKTGRVRHVAGPGVHEPAARRRDQPGAGQGPERAARGHAGAAGHDRPRDAQGPRSLPGARDAEPDRDRGDVRAPGGPDRPIHDEGRRRLPERDRGVRDRRPDDRRRAERPPGADHRGAPGDAAGGRRGLRRPGAQVVRGPARGGDADARQARPGRPAALHPVRGEPAGVDQPHPDGSGARVRARARLRAAGGRARHGARRAAPPAGAVVRGALRGRRRATASCNTIIDRVPVPVVPLRSDDRVRVGA